MSAALALLIALTACNGDKPIEGDNGSGDGGSADGGSSDGGDGECATDTECAAWEICEGQTCIDGDRNNDFDEAESILWDDTAQGYVNPSGDVDYYALAATGGEFVRVRTVHDYKEGDTVVTIRDDTGKVVAVSDEYPTGASLSSSDSTVYAYLATAGTYYIEVEDQGTYYGGDAAGSPSFEYTLSVEEWSAHTEESDSESSPSLDFTIADTNTYQAIGVVIDEPGDSDWLTVTHGFDDVAFWLYGMQDLGGSDASPLVRLWAGDQLVLEQEGPAEGSYAYHPDPGPGTFSVELSDATGDGGDNHWYYVFVILRDNDGAYPIETESNDLQVAADHVSMTETETSSGNAYAFGQGTGFIDAEGDEDWFVVPARPDAEFVICLSSSSGGSLVAPDIEVYDAVGTLLDSTEGNAAVYPTASIDDLVMGSTDTYVRITAPDATVTGPGAWYRFVIYTADFDVSDYEDGGYSCPS